MNSLVRILVAATVLVCTVSCSGPVASTALPPVPSISPPASSFTGPLPDRATIASAAPAPLPADNCTDVTASLRPTPASATGSARPPTPTVDKIRSRGRLIVGLDTGSNLFSFRDPMTGTIEGFDVDIAHEIARDMFGDPNRLEYRILNSADREQALRDGTVDVVVKTMTITCDRKKTVSFSTVYFQAQDRVLVVKGSGIGSVNDLAGKRVCVVDGTTSLTRLQQVQPAAIIVTVPVWADCLVVLQQRQVDAISTDDAILAGLSNQDPYLAIVGSSLSAEPYGVGITKGNDDLVRFVNGTLERIRADGTWNEMYKHWLTVMGPSPGAPYPKYVREGQ